jgi:hypothetical protein
MSARESGTTLLCHPLSLWSRVSASFVFWSHTPDGSPSIYFARISASCIVRTRSPSIPCCPRLRAVCFDFVERALFPFALTFFEEDECDEVREIVVLGGVFAATFFAATFFDVLDWVVFGTALETGLLPGLVVVAKAPDTQTSSPNKKAKNLLP